jgi:hypothetical protein
MNARNIIAALMVVAVTCMATAGRDAKERDFRFPGSRLVEQGTRCPLDEMKNSLTATNTEEVVAKLSALIPEIRRELADPFVSERLPFVQFESSEPGQKIADFLARAFKTDGWTEGRSILGVEFTNCGGDWLRVFSRGAQQVLVHVCGTMERTEDETPDSIVIRTITFRFRGIKPEELLGTDVGRKDRSEQQGGGYSPPATRSSEPTP